MADPYNPYTQYATPTPGGVGYYPPEEQAHQPAYGYQQQPYAGENYENAGQQQVPPNYYDSQPQSSSYHLAPEAYQNNASDRSYTPTGHPDYLGPVSGTGVPQGDKAPENLGYYGGHPADQPRYSPIPSPQPPSVQVSGAPENPQYDEDGRQLDEAVDGETDRGLGSSLAGGAAGYYLGHKKDHGLLGAIGGAIVANFVEHKVKDHRANESSSESHHDGHSHHGHHHHHHHEHRSRSHSRHREDDDY
ncbi:hypothetical protein N7528_001678 [Penicillium herquei]|nr:hypothetical protein N7528_001678 [Penicillium herquei]